MSAAVVLCLCLGTSVARVTQGAPVDALSLGLHFAASLALLRIVATVAAGRRARRRADEGGSVRDDDAALRPPRAFAADADATVVARVPPAQRFDDVVDDPTAHPDCRVVRGGAGAWWRAPYAGPLFALLLGAHALVVPLLRSPWTVAAMALSCVPLGLFWLRGRATYRARRGVALVLTPEALIIRDARGARSAAWRDVRAVTVVERAAWDTLRGAHGARSLVVERVGADSLSVSEDDLSESANAVEAEIDRYRSARAG